MNDLRAIERAIGKALPRVTLPDFDYQQKPTGRLEIPLKERIAKLRAQRAEDRARAKAKEERRTAAAAAQAQAQTRGESKPSGARRKRKRRRGGGGGSASRVERGPYAE